MGKNKKEPSPIERIVSNSVKEIIYNPPVPIKAQNWELKMLVDKYGFNCNSTLRVASGKMTILELVEIAANIAEQRGKIKRSEEIRDLLGVRNIP